ncbi:MAG TPA: TMEM175 family protein [Acidimicrobiales bacterium]|nr:TMEM175 family protein [Acidimicrobiales bacterium]
MNKGRVEAFSDGVFAFAITLLVVTIAQPNDYRHLAAELGRRWPALAAYVVSFSTIGIMWLNHHSIFGHFAGVDRRLVYLNLLLLMTLAFLPYPTEVLGQALARGDARTAAVVYGATMTANAAAWTALWLYASTRRRLLQPAFPESERRTATLLFNAGSLAYAAAIGVAFVDAYAFLAVQGALAVYYAFDPLSRRVQRRMEEREVAASGAATAPEASGRD